MEHARLLEKENRVFCVRCIAGAAFLVLGEMGPGLDPGVRQHEEAHQPPPESEYIPFAVVERYTGLLWGMYLNRVALVLIIKKISAPARGQRFLLCFISKILLHRSEERRVGKERGYSS